MPPTPAAEDDCRPSDPPFLFCILLAARKAQDRMLESLARDWLAEQDIRVVLGDNFGRPAAKAVARG